ncbi:DUF418 domain-containing protein [Adhaeribacter terreus]|uniref:DUF418 domain-containing protein n=1 Tax=Adhaeribacter terreus TaxID=529703 RepID=A0ABW0E5B0_9BACT
MNTLSEVAAVSERRDLGLDILRGFSLVGVGFANLMVFNTDAGTIEAYAALFSAGINKYLVSFFTVFLWGKYFPVFAFLFGLSAALALYSKGVKPFFKRALVLGGLGVLQLIFIWRGDVLHQYALMSLLLLPLRKLAVSTRLWLIAGLYLFSFAGIFLLPVVEPTTLVYPVSTQEIYQSGNFFQIFQRRMDLYLNEILAVDSLLYQLRIFAWLLSGYILGEKKRFRKYFQKPEAYKAVLLSAGIMAAAAFLSQFFGLRGSENFSLEQQILKALLSAVFYTGDVFLLISFPVALYFTGFASNILNRLAPFGKMTLTHYLTQNLLYSLIFYGYGLGLYGKLSPVALWLGYPVLVVSQILLSEWWLKRFGNGPMETLVRYLTTSGK